MEIIVKKTVACLEQQGIILFPTDTIWGLGGDARLKETVSKIYRLKQRNQSKALLCLMRDTNMLKEYFKNIPETAFSFFQDERPTTVILDAPRGIASNMIADDNSLAVRIPKDSFCNELLTVFGFPIIATSANTSGHPSPNSYLQIEELILGGVDYVVPLKKTVKMNQPSRIVKVTPEGFVTVIRE